MFSDLVSTRLRTCHCQHTLKLSQTCLHWLSTKGRWQHVLQPRVFRSEAWVTAFLTSLSAAKRLLRLPTYFGDTLCIASLCTSQSCHLPCLKPASSAALLHDPQPVRREIIIDIIVLTVIPQSSSAPAHSHTWDWGKVVQQIVKQENLYQCALWTVKRDHSNETYQQNGSQSKWQGQCSTATCICRGEDVTYRSQQFLRPAKLVKVGCWLVQVSHRNNVALV